jgi:hypothetical protein
MAVCGSDRRKISEHVTDYKYSGNRISSAQEREIVPETGGKTN